MTKLSTLGSPTLSQADMSFLKEILTTSKVEYSGEDIDAMAKTANNLKVIFSK